uniref:C-type lectin domain-containing protein n=1 Tax=Oreochromis niloticus TaxID=8128 RepID=A0A669DRX8_ORENI
MAERVALVVLCILLAAALIVIYRLSEFGSEFTFFTFTFFFNLKLIFCKSDEHYGSVFVLIVLQQNKEDLFQSFSSLCFNIFKGDSCSKCEEGWEQHGGKCYYFSTSKSSWNKSRDDCRAKGGDLVKIDSREEQFWIGLTDSAEQGRWLWVDGSPLNKSLSYWNDSGPDNWPEDDCVLMGDKGDRYLKSWSDASCKVSHRSICEKPAAKGQNKIVCV